MLILTTMAVLVVPVGTKLVEQGGAQTKVVAVIYTSAYVTKDNNANRMEQTQEMSEYTSTFFQKLMEESKNAETRAAEANDSQINSIIDFQKTYEAQSKSDTDKLIADNPGFPNIDLKEEDTLICFGVVMQLIREIS